MLIQYSCDETGRLSVLPICQRLNQSAHLQCRTDSVSGLCRQNHDEHRVSSILVDEPNDSMVVRVNAQGFHPKNVTIERVRTPLQIPVNTAGGHTV